MRTNTPVSHLPIFTHEGAKADRITPFQALQRSVLTCLLWEDNFYESGNSNARRIAELVPQCKPEQVAALACESRDRMQLRHAPLFLLRELARTNPVAARKALTHVIQRADEMGEFLAMYWADRKSGDTKRPPIAASIKRALADAFPKFSAYELGKYDREAAVKLRDVMFLCHPKPKDEEQAATWKKLVDGTLESPDTWEVALSAGKDKRETFERLIREKKLGGLALLRNLRGMLESGVDESLIRERLEQGAARALPFRFIAAAKYAPRLEDSIGNAMLRAVEPMESLAGSTVLVVDVSGSMDGLLSAKSEMTRLDAACGLAILLREKAACSIYTFSHQAVEISGRRAFALRDAIVHSQEHGGTYLAGSLNVIRARLLSMPDRLIVITDEQSHDGGGKPFARKNYVVNVGNYANGVSYRNGWLHIDGWSEHVIDYIREIERLTDEVTAEISNA